MGEKILHLEAVHPLELFGVNNNKLELIKKAFPKIKIIVRGHEIKILGNTADIEEFEARLSVIIDRVAKYNHITDDELLQILALSDIENKIDDNELTDVIVFGNNGKPVKARTINQQRMVKAIEKNDLLFALGPAGTGKTYTAIALAVRALRNREVKRIVLSRPAVEAGERLGFLPGDLKEKIDPYLQPLYDALNDMVPAKKLETYIDEGVIQIAPLAFMRGRTLSNSFVILDEAQNTTHNQMKMFLTRMGLNSQFIVTGDITQIDLPKVTDSGLLHSLKILENINGISFIEFDDRDIVRHKLVKDIVKAYNKHSK